MGSESDVSMQDVDDMAEVYADTYDAVPQVARLRRMRPRLWRKHVPS